MKLASKDVPFQGKTLKDIDKILMCVDRFKIKEEAIKWVKENYDNFNPWCRAFMKFHNITEEDLK